MGEIEHAGTPEALPAIRTETTTEDAVVAGEILAEPTIKTVPEPAHTDKVADERGMPPIRRPAGP
jgi:hypothetical protein